MYEKLLHPRILAGAAQKMMAIVIVCWKRNREVFIVDSVI